MLVLYVFIFYFIFVNDFLKEFFDGRTFCLIKLLMNDYVFFNMPPTFLILISLQIMNYLRSKFKFKILKVYPVWSQRYRDKNIAVQFLLLIS